MLVGNLHNKLHRKSKTYTCRSWIIKKIINYKKTVIQFMPLVQAYVWIGFQNCSAVKKNWWKRGKWKAYIGQSKKKNSQTERQTIEWYKHSSLRFKKIKMLNPPLTKEENQFESQWTMRMNVTSEENQYRCPNDLQKNIHYWGWRDGPMEKTIYYFYREPRFNSQHSQSSSKTAVTPVPEDSMSSSDHNVSCKYMVPI